MNKPEGADGSLKCMVNRMDDMIDDNLMIPRVSIANSVSQTVNIPED